MKSIKKYLLQFQKELVKGRSETKLLGSLNRLCSEVGCDEFRQAEQAFLEKEYTIALEKYLASKVKDQTCFFCFRAAAFLSHRLEKPQEALRYCREALNLFPMDLMSLMLLKDLLPDEQAQQVSRKIERLMKSLDLKDSNSEDTQRVIATNTIELDGIFQEQPQIGLFCKI